MCPTTRTTGLFDNVAAAFALFALLAKYLQIVGKVTSITTGIDKVLEGGTADLD
jgi:hypothetical protein